MWCLVLALWLVLVASALSLVEEQFDCCTHLQRKSTTFWVHALMTFFWYLCRCRCRFRRVGRQQTVQTFIDNSRIFSQSIYFVSLQFQVDDVIFCRCANSPKLFCLRLTWFIAHEAEVAIMEKCFDPSSSSSFHSYAACRVNLRAIYQSTIMSGFAHCSSSHKFSIMSETMDELRLIVRQTRDLIEAPGVIGGICDPLSPLMWSRTSR